MEIIEIGLQLNETIDEYLEAKRKVKELSLIYNEKGNIYWKITEEIIGKSAVFFPKAKQEELCAQNPQLGKVKAEWDAVGRKLHPLWKRTSELKEKIGDLAVERRLCELNAGAETE